RTPSPCCPTWSCCCGSPNRPGPPPRCSATASPPCARSRWPVPGTARPCCWASAARSTWRRRCPPPWACSPAGRRRAWRSTRSRARPCCSTPTDCCTAPGTPPTGPSRGCTRRRPECRPRCGTTPARSPTTCCAPCCRTARTRRTPPRTSCCWRPASHSSGATAPAPPVRPRQQAFAPRDRFTPPYPGGWSRAVSRRMTAVAEELPETPETAGPETTEEEPVKQRKNGLYPGVSDELAESMRSGWADTELRDLEPIPQAAETAARRAALSARFPGERLVVPAGNLKTRSNDTDYAFRASVEYAYLTG